MVNFGAALKQLRTQAGMTQMQLAKKLGVTKSVVSYYELSERAPSAEMLVKIAGAFHVSTDRLLGLEDAGRTICLGDLRTEDVELIQTVVEALRAKNQNDPQ